MLGLAQIVPTDCQGIPKSLPDDVLKVRVHAGMKEQAAAKEKPRAVDNHYRGVRMRAGLRSDLRSCD